MSAWIRCLCALLLCSLSVHASPAGGLASPVGQSADADVYAAAVEAYRVGDLETAESRWTSLLRADASVDRADVLYNLGNVAWRRGDALRAAARYTACIRLAPRHADAWHNLEFVRSEAGLAPADRGDLLATGERLLGMLTPSEAAWTSLVLLVLFAGALMYEALRGGPLARRLAFAAGVLFALGSLPWLRHALAPEQAPWFVVEAEGAALRSEPRDSGTVVGRLDPGVEAARIDALPGWVRLRASDGLQGWVLADSVVDLSASSQGNSLGS